MKKKVFFIALAFILLIIIATIIILVNGYNTNSDYLREMEIVNINEIKELINEGKNTEANEMLNEIDNYLRNTSTNFNPSLIITI